MSGDTHADAKIIPRWLYPLFLLLLTGLFFLAWYKIDPRLMAIKFIASGSPPRKYTLGVSTLDLFADLHNSLWIVGWISLGSSLLTGLIAWLWPRRLGASVVFTLTAIIYALSASLVIQEQSSAPHYVYLAESFIEGRVHLEGRPPSAEENDWTFYEGQWSISFPPIPAVLMMPFVAFWGIGFNDVIFTLLVGALNVAIFYELLPLVGKRLKRPIVINSAARIGLTLTFGFGTVHWWLSVNGQVWFTAQIVATTFLLLALAESFGKARPFWVTSYLGLAALARPPLLFALPAFIWLLRRDRSWKQLAWGALPLALIGLGMGWYNYLRFDNPFELGYRYMRLEQLLVDRMAETGSFSLVDLRDNIYHAFLNLPELRPRWPYLVMDGWGMSLFLSTPVLIYAFLAPWKEITARTIALAAILVAIPNLLYYNTGYLQAGYRYALDFLPFLLLLVVLGMRGRMTILSTVLITLSILMGFLSMVNFIGLSMGFL